MASGRARPASPGCLIVSGFRPPLSSLRRVFQTMRWIWIDKFLEFRSGQFARAIKNLTLAEEHLHDHFPGYPVMPASLIIEGLAQTGGILVGEAGGFAEKVVLAKIPRAEFLGVACAGDQLIYEVTLTDLRSEGAVVEAKAFLDGELLADAEIVFAHLDNSRANQIFGPKNFVFTQQLLGVLDLAKAQQRARERDQAASQAMRSRVMDSPTSSLAVTERARSNSKAHALRRLGIEGKFVAQVKFVSPRAFARRHNSGAARSRALSGIRFKLWSGGDRRVIHAWFRTPRGHNRSGPGHSAG